MRYQPKTTPFPHQAKATLKAVRAIRNHHRGFAFFMEPRTGKTKAALDAVAILHLLKEVDRVAILCPKVALEIWDVEIRRHFPFRAEMEDYQYRWVNNPDHRGPKHTVRFCLLGYERAARRERHRGKWQRPYLAEIEAGKPDLLILDESHRLKRPGGVTAQGVWRMVRRLRDAQGGRPYVLILTGTPTPQGKRDIFAQYRILDERIFGSAVSSFDEDFVVRSKNPKTPWKINGYRNERKLDRRIRAHSFSISADAAGLAREQFTQNLSVQLPEEVMLRYEELADFFIAKFGETIVEGKNAGAVRTRLLQVTGGFTTEGRLLHTAKVEKLRAYLELLQEQGDSVLVYCRFLPEVAASVDVAQDCGYRAFPFTGSTSDKDRALALATLAQDRRPTAICFQVQAGSLALDLSTAAESVFYSLPDGWEAYWQSRNRVLGPRQLRAVRYTHLLAVGTLDRNVLRNLQHKENLHAEMVKSPRRYLRGMI